MNLVDFMQQKGSFGLVVEGGGGKATPNIYALRELHQHDIYSHFSWFTGSSAGLTQAAYYMAGQAKLAQELDETLVNEKFFSYTRVHNMLDTRLLANLISGEHEPRIGLNITELRERKVRGIAPLTNGQSLQPEAIELDFTKHIRQITKVLAAAMTMPVFSQASQIIDGVRYFDGMLTNPLPLNLLDDKVDHVVVIRPNPDREVHFDLQIHKAILRAVFKISHEAANTLIREVTEQYQTQLHRLNEDRFYVIEPDESELKPQTTNRKLLDTANKHIIEVTREHIHSRR